MSACILTVTLEGEHGVYLIASYYTAGPSSMLHNCGSKSCEEGTEGDRTAYIPLRPMSDTIDLSELRTVRRLAESLVPLQEDGGKDVGSSLKNGDERKPDFVVWRWNRREEGSPPTSDDAIVPTGVVQLVKLDGNGKVPDHQKYSVPGVQEAFNSCGRDNL